MPIKIVPIKKKTPMPKARPKSLKADKTESLDKKFSAGVSATNKKNMKNVKKKAGGGKLKKNLQKAIKSEGFKKLIKDPSVLKKKPVMKKADGGKLKSVPEGNKGLSKLPTPVRNKMGFMKKGGMLNKKGKK